MCMQCHKLFAHIVDYLVRDTRQIQDLACQNSLSKVDDASEASGHKDTKLSNHAAHPIDELRSLANQQIPRTMKR